MKSKEIPEHNRKRLETIGNYLREYRFNEGLTQQEISENTHLHRNSIVRAENGKNYTLLSLFELTDFYQINTNELFSGID